MFFQGKRSPQILREGLKRGFTECTNHYCLRRTKKRRLHCSLSLTTKQIYYIEKGSMNWMDLAILSITGVAAFKGFRTGAIRQAVSLIAFILATFLCTRLSLLIEPFILKYFEVSTRTLRSVSLSLSFILIVIAVRWIGHNVEHLISFSLIRIGNRILGAVVSSFFILLFMGFIFLTIDTIFPLPSKPEKSHDLRITSHFYQPVKKIIPILFYLKSEDIFPDRE